MRSMLFGLMFLSVMGLAFWANQENLKTKAELTHAEKLQAAIGQARDRLSVLNAEWAYQNRPHRLRDLADLNYEHLQLLPLRSDHFAHVADIAFPEKNPAPLNDINLAQNEAPNE